MFSVGGSRAASLHAGKTSASEGCCGAVDCGAAETSSTATAAAAKNSRKCESKVSKIISVLFWTQPRPVVLASTLPLQMAPRFQSWAGFAARSRNGLEHSGIAIIVPLSIPFLQPSPTSDLPADRHYCRKACGPLKSQQRMRAASSRIAATYGCFRIWFLSCLFYNRSEVWNS